MKVDVCYLCMSCKVKKTKSNDIPYKSQISKSLQAFKTVNKVFQSKLNNYTQQNYQKH